MKKIMPGTRDQSIINLENQPIRQTLSLKPTEITIGDLHANIIKLIHILVSVGVFEISTNGYNELLKIYRKRNLSAQDLQLYQNTIERELKNFNPKIIIRFLGDTMCDRGQNDILFLKFLRILAFNRIPYRIIFSNHDAEILRIILKYPDSCPPSTTNMAFNETLGNSFFKMIQSVHQHHISWLEIQTLYHHYYLPSLTLIDYSLQDNRDIFIFSHAPTTLKYIKSLSNELNTVFDCDKQSSLFKSLSDINEAFQYLILTEEITTHLEHTNELLDFIWRREHQTFSIYPLQESLTITYVYGHDHPEQQKIYSRPKHVIRLDNLLGKQSLSNPDNLTLEQTCFLSRHQVFPLTRVNPSIMRNKPHLYEFPWQQWIKQAIAHQIFLDLDPNHELNLAQNQLQLVLNHLRLHPNISDETLSSALESLEQPEIHADFLIIKDNLLQLNEFRILTSSIQLHLAQLDLENHALAQQKKEIENHLQLYENGSITAQTFLTHTKNSINRISRLHSHEANWFKIILNTLLTTAFATLVIFCAFQTSILLLPCILLILILVQLTPFFKPIHIPLDYEVQTNRLLSVLNNH